MASWMGYPTDPDFNIFKLVKPWELTKKSNSTLEDEDMEDESTIGDLVSPAGELVNPVGELVKPTSSRAEDIGQEAVNTTARPGSSLSSDSLAFTLVYCSVFTLTLLYIGFKLSKKWRKQGRLAGGLEDPAAPHPPGRCNHATCQHVNSSTNIPGYAGLGGIWIPELTGTAGRVHQPAGHNTAQCNNRCENCKRLQQPPPSYTNLFLQENPPSYVDAIDVEEAGGSAANSTTVGGSSANSTAVGCSAANCTVVGCTDDNQLCPSYSVSEFMYANKHGFGQLLGASTQSISQTDSTQHSTEDILTHPTDVEDLEDHIMVEIHTPQPENPQTSADEISTEDQTTATVAESSTAPQTSTVTLTAPQIWTSTSTGLEASTSTSTGLETSTATSTVISSATSPDFETAKREAENAVEAIEDDSDSSEITETTEFIDTVSSTRPLEIRAS